MRITVKEERASEILRKWESWRLFKLPFEGNMYLNLAFYYGFQWTIYNIVSAELQEADNVAGAIRVTSNQIQPRIRNLHSKMMKNKPIVDAIPVGYSDDAVFSATLTKKLLDQWADEHCEDDLDSQTVDWLLTCSDCFRKIGFDPAAGDKRDISVEEYKEYGGFDPATGLAKENSFFFNSDGQQIQQGQQNPVSYQDGDIFDDVVPAFEVYFPEYATSLGDTNELMHVKLMTLSDLQDKWGLRKTKGIMPEKDINFGSSFQRRLLGMANPEVGSSTGIADAAFKAEETVYVKELWQKPSRRYPKGRLVIMAGKSNDGVLYDEENPYYDAFAKEKVLKNQGFLPFIHFRAISAPGRIWNISPIEGARPLQAEYNKCISDIIQNRATVGRNKIIAPKMAQIDAEEVANIHGQYLEYSGIHGPQVFPAQALPVQVEREIERNRQDLDTITGSHEVSRAQAPSGVKSGIAINYLLEQDDTTLAPIVQNFERAKEHLAKGKLALAKFFYTEERVIHDSNTEDPVEIMSFFGSEISTKIRIVPGSALPQSRAALQSIYLDMYDRGAILDEQGQPDSKRLFDLMRKVMSIEAFSEDENLDLTRARKENIMLVNGEEILPMPWENQLVHLEEHNRFRKSERYYQLIRENPPVAKNFDMHVQFTVKMLAPPTATPGFEELAGEMGGGGGGDPRQTARISPSTVGAGSGGSTGRPPSPGNKMGG